MRPNPSMEWDVPTAAWKVRGGTGQEVWLVEGKGNVKVSTNRTNKGVHIDSPKHVE